MAESNSGIDVSRELAETQTLLRQRNFEVINLYKWIESNENEKNESNL